VEIAWRERCQHDNLIIDLQTGSAMLLKSDVGAEDRMPPMFPILVFDYCKNVNTIHNR
jgi:hypothetical protein